MFDYIALHLQLDLCSSINSQDYNDHIGEISNKLIYITDSMLDINLTKVRQNVLIAYSDIITMWKNVNVVSIVLQLVVVNLLIAYWL